MQTTVLLGIQAAIPVLCGLVLQRTFSDFPIAYSLWENWAPYHSLTFHTLPDFLPLHPSLAPAYYNPAGRSLLACQYCTVWIYHNLLCIHYWGQAGLQFWVIMTRAAIHMPATQLRIREGVKLLDQLRKQCYFSKVSVPIYTLPPPAMYVSFNHSTLSSAPDDISF